MAGLWAGRTSALVPRAVCFFLEMKTSCCWIAPRMPHLWSLRSLVVTPQQGFAARSRRVRIMPFRILPNLSPSAVNWRRNPTAPSTFLCSSIWLLLCSIPISTWFVLTALIIRETNLACGKSLQMCGLHKRAWLQPFGVRPQQAHFLHWAYLERNIADLYKPDLRTVHEQRRGVRIQQY